jgi:arylsulfatase A-like enzyme
MTAQKPNILFIFTDEHRLSAVGCYGDTPCRTPHLDQLAEQGFRFETAYTVYPVCSPARSTIMTGEYPHTNGMCGNVKDLGCSVHELNDRPELLSRKLQSAGYVCGYTGKWHLGAEKYHDSFHVNDPPSLPESVGFIGQNFGGHGGGGFRFREYKDYLAAHGYVHEVIEPEKSSYWHWPPYGTTTGPVESSVPYFLADHTIGMIESMKDGKNPFFIWHNFWGPHEPYFAPKEFVDMYRDVEIPEWPNYRWDASSTAYPYHIKRYPTASKLNWEDWAQAIRHYYAFTTLIDQQIGRMVQYLEDTGLIENTIIIMTADHGETLGSHGGLIDKGNTHFEEFQRIPMIVRIPEQYCENGREPGQVLSEWVSLADIYPTILDMAGADYDQSAVHGRSFLPVLQGKDTDWQNTAVIEFYGLGDLPMTMITIREGMLKYGWNCSSVDELYDLEKDPYEMNNVCDDPAYADRLKQLRERLAEWMEKTKNPSRNVFRKTRLNEDW